MIDFKKIENLVSNRLLLRVFTLNDKENLYNNWGTDEEINKYMLWKNYKSIEDAENSIKYYIECYNNNSSFRQYAIELKDTNELIGQVSFDVSKRHESAEIAYLMSRKFQNKGYMKESLKLLTNYLFKEIGVTKITAEVMLENVSSIKLLERIGFVQEGIEKLKYKKKDGMFTDVVIMSIIDKERKNKS